ncbi:MAG: iron chaperone [Candidatus Bathyarchaeia archaeon]
MFYEVYLLKKHFETVDEYINAFPQNIQTVLRELRQAIRETAPDAKEAISYQMPAFKLRGNLVWFAAFKDHIGFYPRESAVEAFKEKLSDYEVSKGTVRFPLDKPLPLDLIKEIVRFRVKENLSNER